MTNLKHVFRAGVLAGALPIAVGGALPVWAQPAQPGEQAVQPAATRAQALDQARERAVQLVLDASRSEDPRERAAAIEAAGAVPGRALPMAQLALSDENAGVRFAALVTIGKLQLVGLGPAALDLANDDNPSVRGAAVFAAQRCGEEVPPRQLSYLAQMLGSQDLSTRGNAAMLLGMLGDRSAIPMLEEMARTPMPRAEAADRIWLHLQFAEAILKLNPDDERVLEVVRTSVFSSVDDVRILALRIVGTIDDKSMIGALESLAAGQHPLQLRVAASRSLAEMDSDLGQRVLMRGARYTPDDLRQDSASFLRANGGANTQEAVLMRRVMEDAELCAAITADIRAQSAFGLGELDDAASARVLVGLLDDDHAIVKLAAAAAVLQALAE